MNLSNNSKIKYDPHSKFPNKNTFIPKWEEDYVRVGTITYKKKKTTTTTRFQNVWLKCLPFGPPYQKQFVLHLNKGLAWVVAVQWEEKWGLPTMMSHDDDGDGAI